MKNKDKLAWWDKNDRENADRVIKVGDSVSDAEGNYGIVVKVIPADEEYHGVVYVWQSERVGYGSDNCEHYSFTSWQRMLRIY